MSSHPRPPRPAVWLLERCVPPSQLDSVLGDLEETFSGHSGETPRHPRLWYWVQAVLFAVSYGLERLRPGGDSRHREQMREGIREAMMIEVWIKETAVAVRALWKRPGFVATVVGTLGLGIGATTAIFSVINGALLKPLPYADPDGIVWLSEWWKDQSGPPGGSSMNPANLVHLQETVRTVERITPYTLTSANLSGGDRPQRVRAIAVGENFLSALGTRPRIGRDFTTEEDSEGGPDVAILTHELWSDVFGADPAIEGSTVILNNTPHTVVGVLPPGSLEFPGDPRVLIPLQFQGTEHSPGGRNLNAVGRLAGGVGIEAAREDVMAAYAPREEAYEGNENWSAWVTPLSELTVSPSQRRSLTMLAWSVVAVLLIACLNVANLLLVRAETRQRELAVRVALGAGRGRLIPHLLSEGLVLSILGGAVGVALGFAGLEAIKRAFATMLPRPAEVTMDLLTLGFALAVSVLVGVVVGLLPLVRIRSLDLQADLREGARGSTAGGRSLRKILVVTEMALAVIVLAVAGLLANSFYQVSRIDVGLEEPEDVLVAQVVLGSGYADNEARLTFAEELIRRAEGLPGVTSVGITSRLPLYGGSNFTNVPVVGDPERVSHFVEWRIVTPGVFDALGVDLLSGRLYTPDEVRADTLRSIVINEELSRQLFPQEDALGKRIDLFGDETGLEVIGVVSDLRDMGHERPVPPGVYAPLGNAASPSGLYLMIRSARDPLALASPVRDIVRELDADLPVFGTRTLEDVVDQRLGARRFSLSLLLIFAAVAVLLGSIGVYGVMSYTVTQRTREMGVRLALGAGADDVVRLILRQGVGLTVLGLVAGLAGAWLSTRWITSQLYGVEATDPLTYGAVALFLVASSLLASYLPARRASRTDPLEALRAE